MEPLADSADAPCNPPGSSTWYKGLYDKIPCPCWLTTPIGVILDANPAACRSLGYRKGELVQRLLFSLVHPEDRWGLQAALMASALDASNSLSAQFRLLTQESLALPIRLSFDRLQPVGHERVVLLVGEVLTELQSEEAFLETQQVQLLADAFLGKVAYVDAERRYRFVSQRYQEWSRTAAADILGKSIEQFMFPHQYQKIERYVELALSGTSVRYEFDSVFEDGQHRHLLTDYIPHRNPAGEVLGFFVFCQDITDRKRAEEILHQFSVELEAKVRERTAQLQRALEFEALFKRITDNVRDTLDESQILQTAVQELALGLSVACCDSGMYDLESATSTIQYEYTISMPSAKGSVASMRAVPDLYHQLLQGQYLQCCPLTPGPIRSLQTYTVLACPIRDNQQVLGDLWLFRHHSECFDELEIRLVEQVATQCAIGVRQARLYQAQISQVEALAQLNRLKDDFLSTVSHELRAPMTNMKMALTLLSLALNHNSSPTPQDRVCRYLQILQDECERETGLINDLLNLQRLDAGEEILSLEVIELQSWLPQLVKPFQERAQAQQQRLHLHVSADLPSLLSDRSGLERILVELLNNACKYTPPGEQILLTAAVSTQKIQLKLTNSGTEIPADQLPHIFEKFYRVPQLDRWKHGGTGLGLSLVQKLTEHLGGRIGVESSQGCTCFTIELPIGAGASSGP